jgi:hypothetical protein
MNTLILSEQTEDTNYTRSLFLQNTLFLLKQQAGQLQYSLTQQRLMHLFWFSKPPSSCGLEFMQ